MSKPRKRRIFLEPPRLKWEFIRQKAEEFRRNYVNPIDKAADHWIPLLREEIEEFENVPVLPLGELVLNCLTKSSGQVLIRNYWGYEGPAQYGWNFRYIKPTENVLGRVVFPYPHLPGLSHKIYGGQRMDGYLAFMKEHINR